MVSKRLGRLTGTREEEGLIGELVPDPSTRSSSTTALFLRLHFLPTTQLPAQSSSDLVLPPSLYPELQAFDERSSDELEQSRPAARGLVSSLVLAEELGPASSPFSWAQDSWENLEAWKRQDLLLMLEREGREGRLVDVEEEEEEAREIFDDRKYLVIRAGKANAEGEMLESRLEVR